MFFKKHMCVKFKKKNTKSDQLQTSNMPQLRRRVGKLHRINFDFAEVVGTGRRSFRWDLVQWCLISPSQSQTDEFLFSDVVARGHRWTTLVIYLFRCSHQHDYSQLFSSGKGPQTAAIFTHFWRQTLHSGYLSTPIHICTVSSSS